MLAAQLADVRRAVAEAEPANRRDIFATMARLVPRMVTPGTVAFQGAVDALDRIARDLVGIVDDDARQAALAEAFRDG